MSSNLIVWSDDVVKRAQTLWADGHSAGAIAKALGMTRNAVLGKAFRHPEIFKPRGKTGGAAKARRVVEKLRGPRESATRPKAERAVRAPALPKALPEPIALPAGWTDRDAPRFDLDRYQRTGFEPVAFISLERRQCHFPLQAFAAKAGPDMPCCGAPVAGEDRYCAEHRRLMTGGI